MSLVSGHGDVTSPSVDTLSLFLVGENRPTLAIPSRFLLRASFAPDPRPLPGFGCRFRICSSAVCELPRSVRSLWTFPDLPTRGSDQKSPRSGSFTYRYGPGRDAVEPALTIRDRARSVIEGYRLPQRDGILWSERLKVQQCEAGARHDLIDAVFALGWDYLVISWRVRRFSRS